LNNVYRVTVTGGTEPNDEVGLFFLERWLRRGRRKPRVVPARFPAAGRRRAAPVRRSAVLAAAAAARLAGRFGPGGLARVPPGPAPRAVAQEPLRTRTCLGPRLPRLHGRLDS